jgi:lipopolysaccharide transport system permease protein
MNSSSDYEIVIRPTRGWNLHLAELWQYRDLLLLLVYRDFSAKYKQTVLGPAWFILQPLLTSAVFSVVFAGAIRIPTDGIPPILFYFTGLLGWNYFAQTFGSVSGTFVNNVGIFGKVYFPRLIVPLSTVVSNLLTFALQLGTMLCFWLYFKCFTATGTQFGLSAAVVWAPLVVLQIGVLSFGAGLWLTALTAKYRDFVLLSGFIVQLWMYATPVIYPLSQISDRWRWIAIANPMAMPVEALKYMFLGQGVLAPGYAAASVGMTLLALVSGIVVFKRVEKTFIDTV